MMNNNFNHPYYGAPVPNEFDRYYGRPSFMRTDNDLRPTDRKINRWPVFIGIVMLIAAILSASGNLIQMVRSETEDYEAEMGMAALLYFSIFISLMAAVSFLAHSRDLPFVTALPLIFSTLMSLYSSVRTVSMLIQNNAGAVVFQQIALNILVPLIMTTLYVVITLARPKSKALAIVFFVLQVIRGLFTGVSVLRYLPLVRENFIYLSLVLFSLAGMLSTIMYGIAALFVRPRYRREYVTF